MIPEQDPADPGSGGQKRTGLQPQSFLERGGGAGVSEPPPTIKLKLSTFRPKSQIQAFRIQHPEARNARDWSHRAFRKGGGQEFPSPSPHYEANS